MPFTPFHLGPALLIGLLLYKHLDFPTFLVASVIVDIRAAMVFFGIMDGPLHGILHTFIGGLSLAIILTATSYQLKPYFEEILKFFKLWQEVSLKKISAAAVIGIIFHLLLDFTIYTDVDPFYPLTGNPFYIGILSEVYLFCVLTGLTGLILFLYRLSDYRIKEFTS